MANAEIWLNGEKVGSRPYGYSSFRVDLTPHLRYGGDNVLSVRLNTENLGSRWYPGAGIYRHVRLVSTQPLHVAQWGVFVTTPEVSSTQAQACVRVTLENHTPAERRYLYRQPAPHEGQWNGGSQGGCIFSAFCPHFVRRVGYGQHDSAGKVAPPMESGRDEPLYGAGTGVRCCRQNRRYV